ncbi:MAG TPA: hypothetical protein VL354_12305 [Spirochaetia bacterium]|nr:hypothetical protein [Spirochaetia bacterium]
MTLAKSAADKGNNRIVRFDDMAGSGWTAFGTKGQDAGARIVQIDWK